MAFLVEDGTGVVDANAYIATALFDTFHTDRGNTSAVALSTAQKQYAIIKATEYVDKRFGQDFRGWRASSDQGLEWPRTDAYDNDDYEFDGVPAQLQKAIAEYAWRAHNLGILAPDPALGFNTRDSIGAGTTESATNIESYRVKVGPIEREQKFGSGSGSSVRSSLADSNALSGDFIPAYPEADMWLGELIDPGQSADIGRG